MFVVVVWNVPLGDLVNAKLVDEIAGDFKRGFCSLSCVGMVICRIKALRRTKSFNDYAMVSCCFLSTA